MGFYNLIELLGTGRLEHRDADGNLLNVREFKNIITTSGKKAIIEHVQAVTTTGIKYVALGSGVGSSSPTKLSTSMNSIAEFTAAGFGLTRSSATLTVQAATTARWVAVWTCSSGNTSVQDEAICEGAGTNSTLVAAQTFATVTMNSGDTLTVTHDISFA